MTKQSIFSNIDCHELETTPLSSTGNAEVTANSQGSLSEFAKMYCQQRAFSKFDETKPKEVDDKKANDDIKKEGMYSSKNSLASVEPEGFSFKSSKKKCF